MAYQVLARKWRPQDFSSLIGQGPIVTALRNALRDGRIAQAYLFSGIRGVGKTTAARLLAKALNCEKGAAAGPCNECTACREITAGADLDFLEVDAATYSKVEQVRELTESLRYGPVRDRYKVVVLDEVHRLSRQAFDALLKIVEEPPPHLVFIFATTEIEAVPATILSRCQEYHFRRVPVQELAAHLREICAGEAIEASDAALRLLARAGEGSVRDSVALLDQLATLGAGKIPEEEAARLVGGLDLALFHELLAAILAGRGGEVARLIERVESEGWDPRQVYAHFLDFCRDALHLALAGGGAEVDLPQEETKSLRALAAGAGYENLLRLMQQLLASESSVRRSEMGTLALELAWLRAAELPKLVRVEEILAGGAMHASGAASAVTPKSMGSAGAPPRAAVAPQAAAAPTSSAGARKRAAPPAAPALPAVGASTPPARVPPPSAEPRPLAPAVAPPVAATPEADAGSAPADEAVNRFLEAVSKRKQPLAARLEHAALLAFEEGALVIYPPAGDDSLDLVLKRGNNGQVLAEALVETFGAGTRWRWGDGKTLLPAPETSKPPATAEDGGSLRAHPTVQTVLEIFGGRVDRVEPLPARREEE